VVSGRSGEEDLLGDPLIGQVSGCGGLVQVSVHMERSATVLSGPRPKLLEFTGQVDHLPQHAK
jgi:hypothetical protein